MTPELFSNVDHYINNLFAQEDDVLKSIEPKLVAANSYMALGAISPNQGKFLQLLAHMCNAKRILELGTLGGYSTIWMARTLPADGKLITVEHDATHAAIANEAFAQAGLDSIIELRQAKCMDVLTELCNSNVEPFDLVFMDADKPPYAEYFEMALRLSRPGTIIVADNVVRGGKILDESSTDAAVQGVQRLNKMLSKNPKVHATILQNVGMKDWDGMAIAVVK
jgi:caffeoyl-CoA O-methyltransferase